MKQSPRVLGERIGLIRALSLALSFGGLFAAATAQEAVQVGSKKFTESYVLGEIAKGILSENGLSAEHKQGMGGTIILWQALKAGQIDLYPDYTGTIAEEILKRKDRPNVAQLREALKPFGIGLTESLGFEDKYALAMRAEETKRLGIAKISDLAAHPNLIAGITPEFLDRQDGWNALAAAYGIRLDDVRTVEHALGYQALLAGHTSIKDAYTTDAKLDDPALALLEDDRGFFPPYECVFLYRLDLPPRALDAILKLEGTIGEKRMVNLNAEAEQTKDYAKAASRYLREEGAKVEPAPAPGLASKIARWTLRHLELSGISLLIAILIGVPLGIAASRKGPLSQAILGFAGVVQTIPSLALLALLVPLPYFGIGTQTAVVALLLYSLLPIVRNTATGLREIPLPIRESAAALGLEPGARLRKVYLPMALGSILAGISTSAVINVGTATLAALIGAGGLGEPIVSGLNLNDAGTIMQGAIPAAILALVVQGLFAVLERLIVPRGMRLAAKT